VVLGVPTEVLGGLILQEERPEESCKQGKKDLEVLELGRLPVLG
jgi:hypothetical protein